MSDSKFKIFKELIRSEFLGRTTIDTSTITLGFQSIRQTVFDRGTVTPYTVEQYYIAFMKQVALYPRNEMYPVDLAQQFWVGLNRDVKDQANAQAPPYTPPPRPVGIIEANDAADRCLRLVKDSAIQFERQVNTVKSQVQRSTRSTSRGTPGARTLMAVPQGSGQAGIGIWSIQAQQALHDGDISIEAILPSHSSVTTTLPVDSLPPQAFPMLPTPTGLEVMSQDTALHLASVYLSVAEEALRKATGSAYPPIECWGCTNHKSFHETPFHRWGDCPNRGDIQVQANANRIPIWE